MSLPLCVSSLAIHALSTILTDAVCIAAKDEMEELRRDDSVRFDGVVANKGKSCVETAAFSLRVPSSTTVRGVTMHYACRRIES